MLFSQCPFSTVAVFLYFSFQLFCLEQANGFSHHQGEHSTRHLSVSGPRGRWRVARRGLFCQRTCEGAARRSHLQLRVSPPGRYDRNPLSLLHTHTHRWRFSFRNTTADWFCLYKLQFLPKEADVDPPGVPLIDICSYKQLGNLKKKMHLIKQLMFYFFCF